MVEGLRDQNAPAENRIEIVYADERTRITVQTLNQIEAAKLLLSREQIEESDYLEMISFDDENAHRGGVAVWFAGIGMPDMDNPGVYFLTQRDKRILDEVGIKYSYDLPQKRQE